MIAIQVETLTPFTARFPEVEDNCQECNGFSTVETPHGAVDCPVCTDQNGQPRLAGKPGRRVRPMDVREQHAYLLYLITRQGDDLCN